MHHRRTIALTLLSLIAPAHAGAQVVPDDSASADVVTATSVEPEAGGLPLFVSLAGGYGVRLDPCAQCVSPDNIQSFTGHLSIGTYLWRGLGVGVDASVWHRGHPGLPSEGSASGTEAATGPVPTKLINQLGNASLSFSYQVWHVFARAGVGVALARQDTQDDAGVVSRASGMGVGYSLGGGITLPIAGPASLLFFGNWNIGGYDLSTPEVVLARGVQHEYVELGFGLTIR